MQPNASIGENRPCLIIMGAQLMAGCQAKITVLLYSNLLKSVDGDPASGG
jgi:hypothetical protein